MARCGGYDPPMRCLVHMSAFVLVSLAGAAALAAILFQFAAVRELVVDATPAIGPPAVPLLLDALEDEDAIVQARAGFALREIGPAAVPGLIDSLSNACPDIRRKAAMALGIIAAREAIPQLTDAVRTETHKPARLAAMRALHEIGSAAAAAVPTLLEALASPDAEVRATTADALGSVGGADHAAVAALMSSLCDDDTRVRISSALALGRMGAKEAIPALQLAAQDSDAVVAASARYALMALAQQTADIE